MKNRHGRVGVKKPHRLASEDEIKAKAYERGWKAGHAAGTAEERERRVADLKHVVDSHRNASALNRGRKLLEELSA